MPMKLIEQIRLSWQLFRSPEMRRNQKIHQEYMSILREDEGHQMMYEFYCSIFGTKPDKTWAVARPKGIAIFHPRTLPNPGWSGLISYPELMTDPNGPTREDDHAQLIRLLDFLKRVR